VFDAPYGVLKSPNYPQSYPDSVECRWLINVEWDQSVELTITDLDTEGSPSCTYDYVKVCVKIYFT
jgi:hypothetical protein